MNFFQIQNLILVSNVEQTSKRKATATPLARTPRRKSRRMSLSQKAMINSMTENSLITDDTPRTMIQAFVGQGNSK